MRLSGKSGSAVFLDRDGVVNRALVRDGKPFPPRHENELILLEGVKEAVCKLKCNGFEVAVLTNQPDVSRGLVSIELVEKFHKLIKEQTGINYFYSCFHDDSDFCDCRKPRIGLITKAAKDLKVDIQGCFIVGDRWRDIEAGQKAGCQCFFIDYGYAEERPKPPFNTVTSLLDAADFIIRSRSENEYE